MTPNRCKLSLIMLVLVSGMFLTTYTLADPIVPGFTVTPYANVTDPQRLSFDPSGVLYVGRDNSGSGGRFIDAVKIHRIGVGGSPVVEHGASAIFDPDAVLFDAAGTISGTPGSVLVGGFSSPEGTSGQISVIQPDQSVSVLFGPTTVFLNPGDMAFDGAGRLLFTDDIRTPTNQVFVSTGGSPRALFTLPAGVAPQGIAIDSANRIFTTATDGKIRIHNSAGSLVNDLFVTGLEAFADLAFGTGGAFGTYM